MSDELVAIYAAGVASVDPAAAVAGALDGQAPPARCHIISIGKAAVTMAEAAERWLAAGARVPAGGLVVAPEDAPAGTMLTPFAIGDHPIPGPRSARASALLEGAVSAVLDGDDVLVLLSGGASSLIATSPSLPMTRVAELFVRLLASGLPIELTNLIRRRVLRWAGGGLGAALSKAKIRALAVSDVPGDDARLIGSGPLHPVESREDIGAALAAFGERGAAPVWLDAASLMATPGSETPGSTAVEIVASVNAAVSAARAMARRLGLRVAPFDFRLRGDAAHAGRSIAASLQSSLRPGEVAILGGETTVTLPPDAPRGGRNQHLALAALLALADEPHVALLAAGTDGRDGTTPAAGALVGTGVVDARKQQEWSRMLHAARAAEVMSNEGLTVSTGATGTNVGDLVVAGRCYG